MCVGWGPRGVVYGPAPGWLAPAAQRQEGTGLCLCAEAVPMCHVSRSYLWACLSVCIPQPGQRPQFPGQEASPSIPEHIAEKSPGKPILAFTGWSTAHFYIHPSQRPNYNLNGWKKVEYSVK